MFSLHSSHLGLSMAEEVVLRNEAVLRVQPEASAIGELTWVCVCVSNWHGCVSKNGGDHLNMEPFHALPCIEYDIHIYLFYD